ncbi:vacuolar protein sorting-associated protein 36 isoform X2 [Silene latifolia]|uniref:vacuolar protein sorting-associated protein 36 isoform X2 n=1 Tax=Silene latifolia TaxID=37657 RepID=UPI003D78A3BE
MSDKWLPAAQLTPSGRPILNPGEVECYLISAVDIESGSSPPFKSGLLTLTTHRLIWIHHNHAVFIPLSLITHIHPLSKSFKSLLSISSPRVRFDVSASHSGRVDPSSNPAQGRVVTVTVVMRGKADNHEVFYEKLWAAWRARSSQAHDDGIASTRGEITSSSSSNSVAIKVPVVGVAGILRKEQEMWESTDKSLHDAFQDLNALMSKAREMVMLAEKMRQKLLSAPNNQPGTANDDEMGSKEEIQDWLLSVGIISPVTKESAGALYHQQLSRQLADFVKIPLERAGGMINLIDVYCLFNRARGTELISPDDLLQACTLWEKLDVPVMLRKYDSGVMVIQSKSHSDEEVFGRIRMFILKPDSLRTGISPSDAAITLGIAPAMAKEHLLAAESRGILCRDTSADGLRFFVNIFPDINLDDIYLVNDTGSYALWVASVITS